MKDKSTKTRKRSMTSSCAGRCSSTSAPGRAVCRRTASGPERSETSTDTRYRSRPRRRRLLTDRSAAAGGAYLRLVAAASTLVRVRARVGDGHQSTQVADVHLVRVRRLEQALAQELSGAVSDLTVTLHLAETQAAVTEDGDERQHPLKQQLRIR